MFFFFFLFLTPLCPLSITQVIDLLEGLRCTALPLLCERIFEVPIRDWLVGPALLKDGRYCSKKAPALNEAPSEEGDTSDEAEQGDFTVFDSYEIHKLGDTTCFQFQRNIQPLGVSRTLPDLTHNS